MKNDNVFYIKGWDRLHIYPTNRPTTNPLLYNPLYDGKRMYHVTVSSTEFSDGRELILLMDNNNKKACARLQWSDLPRVNDNWMFLDYKDISSIDAFYEAVKRYIKGYSENKSPSYYKKLWWES